MRLKDKMGHLTSFILFDRPQEWHFLNKQFATTQSEDEKHVPNWSTRSTKIKMAGMYWFWHVSLHFLMVIFLSILFSLPFQTDFPSTHWRVLIIVAPATFLIMVFGIYFPTFILEFLPTLEAAVSPIKAKQQQQVIAALQQQLAEQQQQNELQRRESEQRQDAMQREQQINLLKEQAAIQQRHHEQLIQLEQEKNQHREADKKCRAAQLNNQTIILIQYVLDQTSGMNSMRPEMNYAALLTKLYGVSTSGLYDSMKLVLGPASNREHLENRKLTELRLRFKEAMAYLEEIDFPKGIAILKELELKLLGVNYSLKKGNQFPPL